MLSLESSVKSVDSVKSVSQSLSPFSGNPSLPAVASLIIPGLGQYLLGKRQRGIAILLAALAQAFLIGWSFQRLHVSKVTLGGMSTSWLWLLLAAFWAWNVYDALLTAQGKPSSQTIPVVLTLL